jgi:hypothetical protein
MKTDLVDLVAALGCVEADDMRQAEGEDLEKDLHCRAGVASLNKGLETCFDAMMPA